MIQSTNTNISRQCQNLNNKQKPTVQSNIPNNTNNNSNNNNKNNNINGLYTHLNGYDFVQVVQTVSKDGDVRHYALYQQQEDIADIKLFTREEFDEVHITLEYRELFQNC